MRESDAQSGMTSLVTLLVSVWELSRDEYRGGAFGRRAQEGAFGPPLRGAG